MKRKDIFKLFQEDLITTEGAARLLGLTPTEFQQKYQRWVESQRWEAMRAEAESVLKGLARKYGFGEDFRLRALLIGGENPSVSVTIRKVDPADGGSRPVGRRGRWYVGDSPASAASIYDALVAAGYDPDVASKFRDVAAQYSPAESIRRMSAEMRQAIGAHQK